MKIIEINVLESKSEKVEARIDVHFEEFWLKGFKMIRDEQRNKRYITPPSYRAGNFWRPLFRTDSTELWKEIHQRIMDMYDEYLLEDSTKDF